MSMNQRLRGATEAPGGWGNPEASAGLGAVPGRAPLPSGLAARGSGAGAGSLASRLGSAAVPPPSASGNFGRRPSATGTGALPPPSPFGLPPPESAGANGGGDGDGNGNGAGSGAGSLSVNQLQREVEGLKAALSSEAKERERLTAKVHTDKGAIGENTMGSLVLQLHQLQESTGRDRQVLHELEHHLAEERNARVTVEDDIDTHIEKLETQEKKVTRDVMELEREIDHVGTEVSAMYQELTKLQQQVVTQLRAEYETEIRKVGQKYSHIGSANATLTATAEEATARVARLEERLAASEDAHYEQIEELKHGFEKKLQALSARCETLEKKKETDLEPLLLEQKDHSAAIHNCMDLLEHSCVTHAQLEEAESRMATNIDRLGSGLESIGNEVAGVADGLGACRQEALAVERAASDAEARLEELGEAHSTLERSAEAAMDALEEDLAGRIAQLAGASGEFEEMVEKRLFDLKGESDSVMDHVDASIANVTEFNVGISEAVETVKQEIAELKAELEEANQRAVKSEEAQRQMVEKKMAALMAAVTARGA